MGKGDKLTGVQKAAVLFITMGPEVSSNIIKKMSEQDIQKVTFEIANTLKIKAELKDAVLEEFININKAKDYILEGGAEYAKNLLSKALGLQRAISKLDSVSQLPLGQCHQAKNT